MITQYLAYSADTGELLLYLRTPQGDEAGLREFMDELHELACTEEDLIFTSRDIPG